MIFGDLGISGNNNGNLAIVIEDLGYDFFSVNFCVDMEFYPKHLAYNTRNSIFNAFISNDIFRNKSDNYLFKLNNRELMIELIKESFPILYRIEELIKLKLQPKAFNDIEYNAYYSMFESIEDKEENRDKLWEIDPLEYTNQGLYIFAVNHNEYTKLAFIERMNVSDEFDRFFNLDKSPKKTYFFDEQVWRIKVITVSTKYIELLSDNIHKTYLKSHI